MSEFVGADPLWSALQRGRRRGCGGNFRGWLGGELQFEFLQQEAELGFGLGVASEHQFAAVSGRQMHVDYLY